MNEKLEKFQVDPCGKWVNAVNTFFSRQCQSYP